jgi:hypothetical protein
MVHIGGKQLRALVDLGSTHTFVHEAVVHVLGLDITHRLGLSVKVANGEQLQSYEVCRATTMHIQDEQFIMDCYTLPLGGFDVILGVQWLRSLEPIVWDFVALSMAFLRNGRSVHLHGCGGSPSLLCSVSQQDDLLASLLNAYADIFEEPHGLPPQRRHDHRTHLLPRIAPMAVRPYSYPQLLKDEVERLCTAILMQGMIQTSTSPFSSPVLLVKKADKSWRFCVDYRALNEKTIKDKFPIPDVDELLDELHGARFFTKIDLRNGYHQVRIYLDDIEKTAFCTHHGHFVFTVMPFGLTNAPATFQSLMNDIMKAFICRFVLVFFDDIFIYSSTGGSGAKQKTSFASAGGSGATRALKCVLNLFGSDASATDAEASPLERAQKCPRESSVLKDIPKSSSAKGVFLFCFFESDGC